MLLLKWIVALLVPLAVFTFVWSGEPIVNNVILGLIFGQQTAYASSLLLPAALFILLFYATILVLVGYLVAADSGQQGMLSLWIDILFFVLLPLLLVTANGLILGLALSVLVWALYIFVRNRIRQARNYVPPLPLAALNVLSPEQRSALLNRATSAGFWFATIFALLSLLVDLSYYATGTLPDVLLIWAIVRTILLPIVGYLLGQLGGRFALRYTLAPKANGNGNGRRKGANVDKKTQLESLSVARVKEEAKDFVPNDRPLRSAGAQRFYVLLLLAFLLFYPFIDRFLFGSGTDARLSGYGDAGYYVILALGLNIVVGFAGLLDLGYVAFFAIGAYTWGLIGSPQLTVLTGLHPDPQLLSGLFWPILFLAAFLTAGFGVLLGTPTLRLRGDYLAIVTLGFGEIVPLFFLQLPAYTNGTNGLIAVRSPAFPGVDWSTFTPIPYYYLILAMIALVIFANVRLRDSRIGRAWIALREDEIAAASSGINLVNTKLLAFAAGAFFSGLAGVYHAAKLGGVSPDNFSFGDSVIYLAMVVIGGLGSIPGVIVGALGVYAINQFVIAQLDTFASDPTSFLYPIRAAIVHVVPGFTFGNIRGLIFGVLLVSFMIFRPEGILPSSRRRRELHGVANEEEVVEVGALDAPPGSPGFESDVRVE